MSDKEKPNVFYVYLHRKATDNEVFYVGKGKGSRAKSKQGRTEWWNRIVNKYGYTIEYLEKDLSEDDALDLEKETIKFYRENGHNLCNISDGGGYTGFKLTEENKAKLIAAMLEVKCKPVLCSNGMIFASAQEAERWVGYGEKVVSKVCRRVRDSFAGFVWRYLDDCEDLKEMLDKGLDAYVEWGCENKKRLKTIYCSNGMVFLTLGELIEWFNQQGLYVRRNAVAECCYGLRKSSIHGYYFSYEDKFRKVWQSLLTSLNNWPKIQEPLNNQLEKLMPQIGEYQVSSNNGSKFQKPSIRVKKNGVILAYVILDDTIRASAPLDFLRKHYLVNEHAAAKRQELIDALKRAEVPQEDIDQLLKA